MVPWRWHGRCALSALALAEAAASLVNDIRVASTKAASRRPLALACLANAVEWYDLAVFGALRLLVLPAHVAESPNFRATGIGLTFGLASAVIGGTAPLVASALHQRGVLGAVPLYVSVLAGVGVLAAVYAREGGDLTV